MAQITPIEFQYGLPAAMQNCSVRERREAPLAEWRDLKNESTT
jgi:hypothetical protein